MIEQPLAEVAGELRRGSVTADRLYSEASERHAEWGESLLASAVAVENELGNGQQRLGRPPLLN